MAFCVDIVTDILKEKLQPIKISYKVGGESWFEIVLSDGKSRAVVVRDREKESNEAMVNAVMKALVV